MHRDIKQAGLPAQAGITLIELLVVVLMIGAMASVLVAVIDPASQEEKAYDGVRLTKLNAMSEAIETYRLSEGSYPANKDDPLLTTVYLKGWPEDPNPSYDYTYAPTLGDGFGLFVNNAKGGCYKYQSSWSQLRDCPMNAGDILVCDAAYVADSSDCKDL